MKTKIFKIYENETDPKDLLDKIKYAGNIIREGGLVAFPTETVYGLGADALNPEAAAKIYAAKGRPSDNPLIVHIADMSDLERLTSYIPETARKLAEEFWPGPLTMIFQKSSGVPEATTGGMDTVAIRMPSHPLALALIRESGCVIAAPSANTSGRPSPTMASHVAEDLTGTIPLILDGGPVGIGIESTIVDLTEEIPMILRPGYITPAMIGKVIGDVCMDPGILSHETSGRPKAPGMRYRHYAPKAELVLVSGKTDSVIEYINEKTKEQKKLGNKTGVIGTEETRNRYLGDVVLSIGARNDEDAIARSLYAILREMDEHEVSAIYSECFEATGIGQAIMNRMLKAAGYKIIEI